jgi:hypothetical protein
MSETERESMRANPWSAQQAREVVERWRASGPSASAFATQQDIHASRLSY